MASLRRAVLLILPLAFLFCLVPADAKASGLLQCDGAGGVVPDTTFFYAFKEGDDKGVGLCGFRGVKHIFSTVLCDFFVVLNDTLSRVYCSMQYLLTNTLRLVLTIYIAVFGIQLLMGVAQLNSRDIVMRLIKVSLVWTFATQSAWGVGLIFFTAVAFISDFSTLVVNALAGSIDFANVGDGSCNPIYFNNGDIMSLFTFLDCLVFSSLVGPLQEGSIKLMGLLIAMLWAFPPLTALALWWLSKTFLAMTRAVINFLMAVAAIAFLVSLSPIFLSFILFQATSQFFENWLRYMIAYAVQVVMVFAILVMWMIIFLQFVHFFTELADIIFPYQPLVEKTSAVTPNNAWSICKPEYGVDVNTGAPTAKCPDGFDPYNNPADRDDLQLPIKFVSDDSFLYYVFYHLVSLMIITYAFSVLLDNTPSIAQSIAQPVALPNLVSGMGLSNFGTAGNQQGLNIKGSVGSASRNAAPARK